MKISTTYFLIPLLYTIIFTADASSEFVERSLEDAAVAGDDVVAGGDDAVVAGDDVTETLDDAVEAGDDAVEAGDNVTETGDDMYVASNETSSAYFNSTVLNKVKGTYQAVPAEWSKEQWGFFAALMFIFGMMSSSFFFFLVFPCCCPKTARNAYARFIIGTQREKDWKKVELIKI